MAESNSSSDESRSSSESGSESSGSEKEEEEEDVKSPKEKNEVSEKNKSSSESEESEEEKISTKQSASRSNSESSESESEITNNEEEEIITEPNNDSFLLKFDDDEDEYLRQFDDSEENVISPTEEKKIRKERKTSEAEEEVEGEENSEQENEEMGEEKEHESEEETKKSKPPKNEEELELSTSSDSEGGEDEDDVIDVDDVSYLVKPTDDDNWEIRKRLSYKLDVPQIPGSRTIDDLFSKRSKMRTIDGEVRIGKHWVQIEDGTVIYKGTPEDALVRCVQIGMKESVLKISARVSRELRDKDYRTKKSYKFSAQKNPRGSITDLPPISFDFKDYAPIVFRKIRELFRIDYHAYVRALCPPSSEGILSQMGSPGKSGALFYFSLDGRYIIKTITKTEEKFLFSLLQKYYLHLKSNPDTLLCRFYGCHRITPRGSHNVRFVVMNNFFAHDLPEGENLVKYDLKGSHVGRSATRGEKVSDECILKDNDLQHLLHLDEKAKKKFIDQLTSDAAFLAKNNIMDYSLLLGINNPGDPEGYHNKKKKKKKKREKKLKEKKKKKLLKNSNGNSDLVKLKPKKEFSGIQNKGNKIKRKNTLKGIKGKTKPITIREKLLKKKKKLSKEERNDLQNLATLRFSEHLFSKKQISDATFFQVDFGGIGSNVIIKNGKRSYYFFGIIDILQTYNSRKRLEYFLKGFRYSRKGISCNPPGKYSKRFVSFMQDVVHNKKIKKIKKPKKIKNDKKKKEKKKKKRKEKKKKKKKKAKK